MSRLRNPLRRFPAGVDRRFDDAGRDTNELIRLARRGHVFCAADERPRIANWSGDDAGPDSPRLFIPQSS